MNCKPVVVLTGIVLAARIAVADVNIEKLRKKSFDLADLVKAILEDREPQLRGKINQDEDGYFLRCFMPDDAIKVFADASESEITEKGENRYVFSHLKKGGGIVARLKCDKLYVEKVADLKAYKIEISHIE
jgi:hypothetical protein